MVTSKRLALVISAASAIFKTPPPSHSPRTRNVVFIRVILRSQLLTIWLNAAAAGKLRDPFVKVICKELYSRGRVYHPATAQEMAVRRRSYFHWRTAPIAGRKRHPISGDRVHFHHASLMSAAVQQTPADCPRDHAAITLWRTNSESARLSSWTKAASAYC